MLVEMAAVQIANVQMVQDQNLPQDLLDHVENQNAQEGFHQFAG